MATTAVELDNPPMVHYFSVLWVGSSVGLLSTVVASVGPVSCQLGRVAEEATGIGAIHDSGDDEYVSALMRARHSSSAKQSQIEIFCCQHPLTARPSLAVRVPVSGGLRLALVSLGDALVRMALAAAAEGMAIGAYDLTPRKVVRVVPRDSTTGLNNSPSGRNTLVVHDPVAHVPGKHLVEPTRLVSPGHISAQGSQDVKLCVTVVLCGNTVGRRVYADALVVLGPRVGVARGRCVAERVALRGAKAKGNVGLADVRVHGV